MRISMLHLITGQPIYAGSVSPLGMIPQGGDMQRFGGVCLLPYHDLLLLGLCFQLALEGRG